MCFVCRPLYFVFDVLVWIARIMCVAVWSPWCDLSDVLDVLLDVFVLLFEIPCVVCLMSWCYFVRSICAC